MELLRRWSSGQRPRISHLTPIHPPPSITLVFKPWEEEQLAKVGASKTSEGKWLLPDGKEMLSKLILRKLLTQVT